MNLDTLTDRASEMLSQEQGIVTVLTRGKYAILKPVNLELGKASNAFPAVPPQTEPVKFSINGELQTFVKNDNGDNPMPANTDMVVTLQGVAALQFASGYLHARTGSSVIISADTRLLPEDLQNRLDALSADTDKEPGEVDAVINEARKYDPDIEQTEMMRLICEGPAWVLDHA